MSFQRAAAAEDLWQGEMLGRVVSGRRVLLLNVGGVPVAFEDRCAHLGVPLSEGRLDGSVLSCRAHKWEYDVQTGRGRNPASARLKPLAVKVEGDGIWVDVESSPKEGGTP